MTRIKHESTTNVLSINYKTKLLTIKQGITGKRKESHEKKNNITIKNKKYC